MDYWIELVGLIVVGVALFADAHRQDRQLGTREASARPRGKEQRCPYCHEGFASEAALPVVRCTRCDTPHHAPCWEDDPHCAVYGCGCEESVAAEVEASPPEEGDSHLGKDLPTVLSGSRG